jgi:lipoprotein-anchoring transpeptidase ErfK/SrfK
MHTRERKRKEDEESKMKANSNSSDTMKVKRAFSKKPPKLIMALGITLVAAILVIAGVIFYQKVHYQNRWYQNTFINDVDVSGQTLEESRKKLLQVHDGYALTIKGREEGHLTIDGDTIDYQFDINSDFEKLFNEQHDQFHLFVSRNNYTLEYAISYDESKLSDLINQSDLVAGSESYPILKPQSATVSYDEAKQQYVCVDEILGNKIISNSLYQAVTDALKKAQSNLDITDSKKYPTIYKAPKITSDNEELQTALSLSNSAALRYIEWNMGEGVKEQITPTEISQWITYKNGKIKYDNEAIADWVENFCLKYKTVGKTRTIKSHNKKPVKIYGGDYGWQLDYEKTLAQAQKAIKLSIDKELTQNYVNDPSEENKKALTLKRKVIYANTAFRKDYKNYINDWDPENYIEISIKEQKVYVIRNGKVAFSCKCITGLPVEGRSTPTGAFFIKEHREAYTLTGADYKTPVTSWVRITWTGTGFHSATWQPWSRWTKDLYLSKGSHGCINLTVADAAKIYKMSKYREATFIH